MYPWVAEDTGFEIDVLRSPADSMVPPTKEEVEAEQASLAKVGKPVPAVSAEPKWKRLYGAALLQRGPNWRGAKGFWGKV